MIKARIAQPQSIRAVHSSSLTGHVVSKCAERLVPALYPKQRPKAQGTIALLQCFGFLDAMEVPLCCISSVRAAIRRWALVAFRLGLLSCAGVWAWLRLPWCFRSVLRLDQDCPVVPGHPQLRSDRNLLDVPLQLGQVIERVGVVQLAGVDQAHEQVADAGAVLGLVKKGILAVKDGFLQCTFGDIIVQRGTCLTQEQGELVPVPKHGADGTTQGRI